MKLLSVAISLLSLVSAASSPEEERVEGMIIEAKNSPHLVTVDLLQEAVMVKKINDPRLVPHCGSFSPEAFTFYVSYAVVNFAAGRDHEYFDKLQIKDDSDLTEVLMRNLVRCESHCIPFLSDDALLKIFNSPKRNFLSGFSGLTKKQFDTVLNSIAEPDRNKFLQEMLQRTCSLKKPFCDEPSRYPALEHFCGIKESKDGSCKASHITNQLTTAYESDTVANICKSFTPSCAETFLSSGYRFLNKEIATPEQISTLLDSCNRNLFMPLESYRILLLSKKIPPQRANLDALIGSNMSKDGKQIYSLLNDVNYRPFISVELASFLIDLGESPFTSTDGLPNKVLEVLVEHVRFSDKVAASGSILIGVKNWTAKFWPFGGGSVNNTADSTLSSETSSENDSKSGSNSEEQVDSPQNSSSESSDASSQSNPNPVGASNSSDISSSESSEDSSNSFSIGDHLNTQPIIPSSGTLDESIHTRNAVNEEQEDVVVVDLNKSASNQKLNSNDDTNNSGLLSDKAKMTVGSTPEKQATLQLPSNGTKLEKDAKLDGKGGTDASKEAEVEAKDKQSDLSSQQKPSSSSYKPKDNDSSGASLSFSLVVSIAILSMLHL